MSLPVAVITLMKLSAQKDPDELLIAMGVLNMLQWAITLVYPFIQAARLDSACTSLKKLGHSVRARPLSYMGTTFLHLDSFLSYVSSVRLKVKLLLLPVTPGLVAGALFLAGCVFVFLLQRDTFAWAKYL